MALKPCLIAAAFAALAFAAGTACAGPLEDGVAAAERGDLPTARAKFEPLANAGDPLAAFYLGSLIVRYAADQHKAEGVIWLQAAAKAGVVDAMNQLAVVYGEGKIVAPDQAKATELLMQAASLGFVEAYHNLGLRAANGIGAPRDLFSAMEWFRLAADQGYVESQESLGILIAESDEVRTNPKKAAEAYMWLTLATRAGDGTAAAARKQFAATMKPAEIAEGDRLVAAWKPVKPLPKAAKAPSG